MPKKVFANNRIRAKEVRLIDKEGNQLGVVTLGDALRKAQADNLDLIQVTEHVNPPVCKITDYGKYIYRLQKKEKNQKAQKSGELKSIRLRFNISPHDLETRVRAAEKFLKKGYNIKIEMVLRGREKRLSDFAKEKIKTFLTMLQETTAIKIEKEIKRSPRGFTMLVRKS